MRLVLVAAALVGVAVLAACADGETANETLPATTLTSGSAEPSRSLAPLGPADFPVPDEARQQTPAGATAFIRYYLELMNRSTDDMDTTFLRQLAQECATCQRVAQETEMDAAAGYHYVGGDLILRGELQAAITAPGQAQAAFLLDQQPLQVATADGRPVPDLSFPAIGHLSSGASLTWRQETGSWALTELTLG
jgi:Family of unknown function (DUF6318)